MKPYGHVHGKAISGGRDKKHKENKKFGSCSICHPKFVNKRLARRRNKVYHVR